MADKVVKKPVFVADFKLNLSNPNIEAEFSMTIKDAEDITEALWQARDAARTALNVPPYDEPPAIKNLRERGW